MASLQRRSETLQLRLAVVLEERLDELAPTRVPSLANCGDDLVNHAVKHRWVQEMEPRLDLTIFVLVNNAVLFDNQDRYDAALYRELIRPCQGKPLFDPPSDRNIPGNEYWNRVQQSYDGERYANYCVLEYLSARKLPRQRAVYIVFGALLGDTSRLVAPLIDNGLRVLDLSDFMKRRGIVPDRNRLTVSARDGHPSHYANQLATEMLFEEITAHPRYGFAQP